MIACDNPDCAIEWFHNVRFRDAIWFCSPDTAANETMLCATLLLGGSCQGMDYKPFRNGP